MISRAISLSCLLLPLFGCAAKVGYRGRVAADGRVFFHTARLPGQRHGNGVSIVAEPEFYAQSKSERHQVTARPFLRFDAYDGRRTHWDFRRADYVLALGSWEIAAGSNVFTWGVLEGYRPSDIVNQIDFVESYDRSQKLGQPYVAVSWLPGDWAIRLYALPYFRELTTPGAPGRLRFAAVVDEDNPIYEPRLKQWYPSAALRVSGSAGGFDLGFAVFSGISREPRFVAQLTDPRVVPAYDLAHQASFDVQFTYKGLALKGELMGRLWSADLRLIVGSGVGLEYTFFNLFNTGADLTAALEYYYDSRPLDAAINFFTNDIFLGLRLAANDRQGTTFQIGTFVDLGDLRTYFRFEAHRRPDTHWRLGLQVNAFFGPAGELESGLLYDHHVQLQLAYFF